MPPDNLPEIPTLVLSTNPNRRAEFWSAEREVVVYQYNDCDTVATAVDIMARAWLSSAAGNCVNFCS